MEFRSFSISIWVSSGSSSFLLPSKNTISKLSLDLNVTVNVFVCVWCTAMDRSAQCSLYRLRIQCDLDQDESFIEVE